MEILNTLDITSLSEIDKTIYLYIQKHPKQITTMKIQELSSLLFTSNATIIRFCKKLGCSGFNELKYSIKEELHNQNSTNHLIKKEIEKELVKYKDYIDNLPMDTLLEVVDLICNKQPLYIHGRSLSAIPAKYLYTVLNSIDRRCVFMDDLHLLKSICQNIDSLSTIVLISANANYEVFENILLTAKQNGAKIVLITANHTSKTCEMADITILTDDMNTRYRNIDVNTRIDILTVIQMLIEVSCQRLLK